MRKIVLGLVAFALLIVCCPSADAAQFGPLTIKQIQDPSTLPNPVGAPNPSGSAAGDTVASVTGVITGFDTFATGFAFYIQDGPGPWTGIDVFTGGTSLFGTLQLGDNVTVGSCALAEFSTAVCIPSDGGTEIISKNGSFGAGLVVTKNSSGNPLPPFHVGTVAELQELCTNPNAEQWEGCLVKINGPLRICRTDATGGTGNFRTAIVVNDVVCPDGSGGPCDTVFIDLSTLANPALSAGSVGQKIDFVQGLYDERTRGYRIQVRNSNDYGLAAPPNVVRVFAVANNKYRVIMDRDITLASAENEANYTVASLDGNPSLATRVDPTTIDLTVNGTGLLPGDPETVQVNGLTSSASGLSMTAGQGPSFHAGILTPAQVQGPDTDSLSVCSDIAKYKTGGPITVEGVCTGGLITTYWISGSNAPRDGIAMFAPPQQLIRGHKYLIVCTPQEFFNLSELISIVYVVDEGVAPIPSPIYKSIAVLKSDICDAAQAIDSGEDYEGCLVQVSHVRCTETRGAGLDFFISSNINTPGDSMQVDNFNTASPSFTFAPDSNLVLNVRGLLNYDFGTFRICPRDNNDIEVIGTVTGAPIPGSPTSVNFSIFPNPAPQQRVDFSIPVAQHVELGVYDLAGRHLATLAKGHFDAGSYVREWKGLDSSGKAVGPGVYFYRLTLANETRVLRAITLD